MTFPRYPRYKDSGVEWLGEVPEHWEVKRLRQLGPLLKGSGGSKEDVVENGVPCVRYGDLYTTHSFFIHEARTRVTAERAEDYTPIQFGDVLFAASGEKMSEIGKSAVNLMPGRACCGGDLVLLRPDTSTGAISFPFLGYACDCQASSTQKASMGRGTTIKHIYPDELRQLLITLPPYREQVGIASFLDRETAKIDALVAEQEGLIELLKEKRQAVISHAVTKGLNPDAPMKDSGIEWLGEVPSHWYVTRLKYATSEIVDCPHETPIYDEDGNYCVIRTADLDAARVLTDGMRRVDESEYRIRVRRLRLQKDDIVYGREGERWGHAGLVPAEDAYCLGQRMMQFRARSGFFSSSFLMWQLNARHVYLQGALDTVGATSPHVNVSTIRNYVLAEPPLEEQSAIASFLDQQAAVFDSLTFEAQHTIELLEERRAALISAAVTGQIDVRKSA